MDKNLSILPHPNAYIQIPIKGAIKTNAKIIDWSNVEKGIYQDVDSGQYILTLPDRVIIFSDTELFNIGIRHISKAGITEQIKLPENKVWTKEDAIFNEDGDNAVNLNEQLKTNELVNEQPASKKEIELQDSLSAYAEKLSPAEETIHELGHRIHELNLELKRKDYIIKELSGTIEEKNSQLDKSNFVHVSVLMQILDKIMEE